jgi:molybdate transport system permease protein
MDFEALLLSLKLAMWTLILILPFGVWMAHSLQRMGKSRSWIEAALALPLVLPPTVLGYYFLVGFGGNSFLGVPLVFSFAGILIASLIVNLPFAIQPIQRAFESINPEIREAAQVSGLSNWQIFRLIELPLAWRGITSAAVLTFAHTLGEFGVILMVGGAIPGETKTVSIAIYDKVQSFDTSGAGALSLLLLAISLIAIALSYGIFGRQPSRQKRWSA